MARQVSKRSKRSRRSQRSRRSMRGGQSTLSSTTTISSLPTTTLSSNQIQAEINVQYNRLKLLPPGHIAALANDGNGMKELPILAQLKGKLAEYTDIAPRVNTALTIFLKGLPSTTTSLGGITGSIMENALKPIVIRKLVFGDETFPLLTSSSTTTSRPGSTTTLSSSQIQEVFAKQLIRAKAMTVAQLTSIRSYQEGGQMLLRACATGKMPQFVALIPSLETAMNSFSPTVPSTTANYSLVKIALFPLAFNKILHGDELPLSSTLSTLTTSMPVPTTTLSSSQLKAVINAQFTRAKAMTTAQLTDLASSAIQGQMLLRACAAGKMPQYVGLGPSLQSAMTSFASTIPSTTANYNLIMRALMPLVINKILHGDELPLSTTSRR
jgi:hypothetical protein